MSVLEKNFDILEAADGKETIATLAAHEGNIAALLLDVVMPEADGFEVLEEMNRRGWIDEIPTIMMPFSSARRTMSAVPSCPI